MVADNVTDNFAAGPYRCAEDNGQYATLHGFLGGKILQSNLQITVTHIMLHPNLDLVSREVSRICNVRHIGTKMMQSFIFHSEIVHEMDAADHCTNREIRPSALYITSK